MSYVACGLLTHYSAVVCCTRTVVSQEVLALIEERLGELEREKAELTEYESLDRQRKALDFTLYERQCSKVRLLP